jgi:hypothetical protein
MSELVKIYDLSLDSREIEQVQQATLSTKDYGLKPIPALFGSPEWWKSIESGVLPVHTIVGKISRVYMSGHNDFPEFEIDDGQIKTKWMRRGEASAYVVGRGIRIRYVEMKFKKSFGSSPISRSVLTIEVETEQPTN